LLSEDTIIGQRVVKLLMATSTKGRTARTPALRGLQSNAERGRTPRLSLGSLRLWRCTRPLPAPH